MANITPLFELLKNVDLIAGSRINERRVLRLSAGQLSDIGAQAAMVTQAEALTRETSSMTHSATLSMGGGTAPCANLSCRIRHVDQLVQFAAFYSDKVYIHNFLSNHEHQPHSGYIPSLDERRYTLLDDLYVLLRLRPLIEAGLIVPVTSTDEVCPQCIAFAFGAADKRFLRQRKQLAKRFLEEMTIFLSDRDGEWLLACEAPKERRNSLVQKHLTSIVPFIGDASPTTVVQLRRREEESFLTYRQALNRAIDDVRAERAHLKESDARAIYSDVIVPSLARLDRAVRTARRDLLKDFGRSVGAWTGAITFGIYTGLLPDQLVGAAKALGLTKILADFGQAAERLMSPQDPIKKEDLYFLWRVRQMSHQRR